MTVIYALIRTIGLPGCAVILALLYYEGVPGINRLPFVDAIPLVRELGVGRVELERRKAVAGLVSAAELASARAALAEQQRLLDAARQAESAKRERAAGLSRLASARAAELDAQAAEAEGTPGLTRPSAEDLQWLAR